MTSSCLLHLAEIQTPFIRAIESVGARPLIFESGATPPLLPPTLFPQLEAPALAHLFSLCRSSGAPCCIIGGDVLPILKDLVTLDPGFLICPSETNQTAFADLMGSRPDISVRVNMPVSSVMSRGWNVTREAADAALLIAERLPNSSVGTGVIPVDADPARILHLKTYIETTIHLSTTQ